MTRDEYIAGLRATADWLEDHPDVPAPDTTSVVVSSDRYVDLQGEAWVCEIAARIGAVPVVSDRGIEVSVQIGPGEHYRVMHTWARMRGTA